MDLSDFIIQESATVLDAAKIIDQNGKYIVFICDGLKLLASFTDGDLRRYILKSGDLTKTVSCAANRSPLSVSTDNRQEASSLLANKPHMRGIPVLNTHGEIISVVFSGNLNIKREVRLNTPVVIMAGGKGTRLAPYTDILPKPLIPIGGTTITEHIMERFTNVGCNDFTIIINHKKELIKAYFKETPHKGNIRFVDEVNFCGTGGGLSLLAGMFDRTFFMSNCDILVDADYEDILEHHRQSGAQITMVCSLKRVSVPYGTVELDDDGKPTKFIEKPEYPILTNTGLYLIEPSFLDIIPKDTFIHITELIQQLMNDRKAVGMYPIGENGWLDMGQVEEMMGMQGKLV